MKFSSLVAPKVVILTTSAVASDENFFEMTFPFPATNASNLSNLRPCDIPCIYCLHAVVCGDHHHSDVIMSSMASQITSLTIVYSTVYSGADQRKHQSSASLAFVRGIHRSPVNSPHKGPVTRKVFPFDDVIMVPVWAVDISHGISARFGCVLFVVFIVSFVADCFDLFAHILRRCNCHSTWTLSINVKRTVHNKCLINNPKTF